ncbi:MAG: hypothetical protein WCR74_08130 [Betaproteobacteria bacterium]
MRVFLSAYFDRRNFSLHGAFQQGSAFAGVLSFNALNRIAEKLLALQCGADAAAQSPNWHMGKTASYPQTLWISLWIAPAIRPENGVK